MSKGKGRGKVRVYIHDLWWVDKLKVLVPYPKGVRKSKKLRRVFADGVAAGVVASLNSLEVSARSHVVGDEEQQEDS